MIAMATTMQQLFSSLIILLIALPKPNANPNATPHHATPSSSSSSSSAPWKDAHATFYGTPDGTIGIRSYNYFNILFFFSCMYNSLIKPCMQEVHVGSTTRINRCSGRIRPRWALHCSTAGQRAELATRSNVTPSKDAKRDLSSSPLLTFVHREGRGGATRLRNTSTCPSQRSSRLPNTRLALSQSNIAGEDIYRFFICIHMPTPIWMILINRVVWFKGSMQETRRPSFHNNREPLFQPGGSHERRRGRGRNQGGGESRRRVDGVET